MFKVQAGWDGAGMDWRPQLRALHLLHFVREQGGDPGKCEMRAACLRVSQAIAR